MSHANSRTSSHWRVNKMECCKRKAILIWKSIPNEICCILSVILGRSFCKVYGRHILQTVLDVGKAFILRLKKMDFLNFHRLWFSSCILHGLYAAYSSNYAADSFPSGLKSALRVLLSLTFNPHVSLLHRCLS